MYICLHVKCLWFLTDFNDSVIFGQIIKCTFHENPLVGRRVVSFGHNNGRTDKRKDRFYFSNIRFLQLLQTLMEPKFF